MKKTETTKKNAPPVTDEIDRLFDIASEAATLATFFIQQCIALADEYKEDRNEVVRKAVGALVMSLKQFDFNEF